MYSYKQPREKPIFDTFTKMWLIFVSIALIGVLGYGFYLYNRSSNFSSKIELKNRELNKLQKSILSLKKSIKSIQKRRYISDKIDHSNLLLKNSMKNLFSLVPDQIVLSKLDMDENRLKIEGFTLTKNAYKLLLEPPLKSIFTQSKVIFKYDPYKGKYKFVSINHYKEDK